ncbi:MAG: LamG-like jellyroll fold domain-containing protein, partial [Rhodospirillales bacterium]
VLKAGDGSVLAANSDGSYTLSGDQLSGLTLTPPADFSGEIDLAVTATSQDGADTAETTGTMTVSVAGIADAPTLDLDPDSNGNQSTGAVVGVAGAAIALNIASALTDDSETLSITIGNVPDGALLSAGTDNGDGTWTLSGDDLDQLSGLTITPAADSSGDFSLTVTATSKDGTSTAETTGTIALNVEPAVIADNTASAPTLDVGAVQGLEDTAIALNISAALTDLDGSEALSIKIAGVPDGATLSAGTDNHDGTWTLTQGQLADLTVTPKDDSNVDFDLTVTATSTEANGGATTTTTASFHVGVTGVADAPTVVANVTEVVPPTYPDAVQALEPVAYWRMNELDDGTMVDSAGNHNGTYKSGAESDDGKHGIGAGVGDFDGHNDYIKVPHSPDFALNSGSVTMWINSDDVDDRQGLFSKDSTGYDNGGHLTGYIDDGEVKVRLQSGGQSFWVDGGHLKDNTWHQITFNWGEGGMKLYVDGQLVDTNSYTGGIANNTEPLVIGANAWDSDDGQANHLENFFDGQIDEVAIVGQPLTPAEITNLYNTGGQAIIDNGGSIGLPVGQTLSFELDIGAALGDLDGSETLSIVVGGLPDGAHLSAGTLNADGSYTLTKDDLDGLTLTTDHTVIENFDLSVTAVSEENDGDMATSSVSVAVVVDDSVDQSVSLEGGSGADVLIGGTGDDILKGRGGDDQLLGGGGQDTLFGSSGHDTLDGGSGNDMMFGSSGNDILTGGTGNDYLDGGSGNDKLYGGDGDDEIVGGGGNDYMDGGAGNDVMTGSGGADTMYGGTGNDTMYGGGGKDYLDGGAGDDRMFGSGDSDTLVGGAGNDVMTGGGGTDTFIFDSQSGHDIITDILHQDVMVFEGQEFHLDDLQLSENSDGDVVVAFQGVQGTSVTLSGVKMSDLDHNHDGDPSDGYSISQDGDKISITVDPQG